MRSSEANKKMHMVFCPADGNRFGSVTPNNSPHIGVQTWSPFLINPGLSVPSREDDVAVQI